MTETILGIIGAVLTIVAMIFRYLLKKEKTKAEKVKDAVATAYRDSMVMRRKLKGGHGQEVADEMDSLDRSIRALMRVYKAADTKR